MKTSYALNVFFCSIIASLVACKTPSRSISAEKPAIVHNLIELKDMLRTAQPGTVLTLEKNAEFDLSGEKPLEIPGGITIEGNGAHFFSKSAPLPMMKTMGANVTIKNLKIEGPEKETREIEIRNLMKSGNKKATYFYPIVRGVEVNHLGALIEGCELWGWSHAAIQVGAGANAVIQRNKIHHNQRTSLGYGVVLVGRSSALISHNEFDYNRHSIAGSGESGQSYEASYNRFGAHHTQSTLDMHGGQDRKDGTNIAGQLVNIHHNIFLATQVPVFLFRGIPEEKVIFKYNRVSHSSLSEAVVFRVSYGFHFWNIPSDKLEAAVNVFGP